MLDQLHQDLLIIIINLLNFADIINLLKLNNNIISESCKYYKYIDLYSDKDNYETLFNKFKNPERLIIDNAEINIAKVFKYVIKKEWCLKSLGFIDYFGATRNNFDHLLKTQTKLDNLVIHNFNSFTESQITSMNKNIKCIALTNSDISEDNLIYMNNFKSLEVLKIIRSRGRIECFDQLFYPKLKYLDLSGSYIRNEKDFFAFLKRSKNLLKLTLNYVFDIYDLLYNINQACPRLKKLSLNRSVNATNIFNDKLDLWSKAFWPNLTELSLNSIIIFDDQIIDLIHNSPKLINLYLSNTCITDISVIYICLKLPNLQVLDIGNNNITNTSANHIAIYLHKLKFLNIEKTILNTYYVKKIIKNNNLKGINITGCMNINKRKISFGVQHIVY